MLIQWVPMNAGREPASAWQPAAARSMPRVFPRTPAGVRVDFWGLGFLLRGLSASAQMLSNARCVQVKWPVSPERADGSQVGRPYRSLFELPLRSGLC